MFTYNNVLTSILAEFMHYIGHMKGLVKVNLFHLLNLLLCTYISAYT